MNRYLILFFWILVFFIASDKNCFSQDIFDAARKGDTLRILDLMKLNPDTIHKPNKNGFSPLILACYRNQTATAKFLIRQNVDIDFISPEGTALMAAVYKGEIDLAEKLLQQKANPDLSNDLGTSALMLAVSGSQKNMVQLLLDYKCNINLKDKEGIMALQIAKTMGNKEIVDLLSR